MAGGPRSGAGQEEALGQLEVNLVRSRAMAAGAELPAWQQQLRSLVQAGIPMVRGPRPRRRTVCGAGRPSGARREAAGGRRGRARAQALRGKLWKVLLRSEAKRSPGVYQGLVAEALGRRGRRRVRRPDLQSPGWL